MEMYEKEEVWRESVDNLSETNWLSMLGGGVGIGFGIRSADDVFPFLSCLC